MEGGILAFLTWGVYLKLLDAARFGLIRFTAELVAISIFISVKRIIFLLICTLYTVM